MKRLFRVNKKKLDNGLQILVHPTHNIPEVVVQIWYNVGSKDEEEGERGMAHLIEHMIFKGTKKLAETDIDLITAGLAGYSNAFTSNDYTGYYFKFPSNVWEEGLKIFADCMKNARFDEQMLSSEMHAVIQELKLYRDDYQESLMEKMLSEIFTKHPYRHPIIGYKEDLFNLRRDDLFAFYKKHYHPANATIIVAGDIEKDELFEKVEKLFGNITVPKEASINSNREKKPFLDDLCKVSVTLPREVENPWALYAYPIPGTESGTGYLFSMIERLIANGRSSRLYERLVNELKLATEVGAFTYDLFEKSLFFLYVQPVHIESLPRIEKVIEEEISKLFQGEIEDWEFLSIKHRGEIAFYSLLEDISSQAEMMGHFFLAMNEPDYVDWAIEKIKQTKRRDIQDAVKKYLIPANQHKGYLLPANEDDKKTWHDLQVSSDLLDIEILKKFERTTPVEQPKVAFKIKDKLLPDFEYPKPKEFLLDNGLEVVYLHRPSVPKISVRFSLKADYLYDPSDLGGLSSFLHSLLLEGTRYRSAQELSRFVESHGMSLSSSSGLITLEMLSADLEKGLVLLHELLTEPACSPDAIEKVRSHFLMELKEFWDSPISFVDQLASEAVYGGHPYAKNRLGYKECVQVFNHDHVFDFFNAYFTPEDGVLVIVGDLGSHDSDKLKKLIEKTFGRWKGKKVKNIVFPEISYAKPTVLHHEINRDQMVLAFAAPSISRVDPDFDALCLLDFIFTGGGISSSSRLYQLREQTGIFYSIGGSLVYGADTEPGMIFIKTLVSLDKASLAEDLIKKEMKKLHEDGISLGEFGFAAKSIISSSVRAFEGNTRITKTFLFIKRCGLNFDLFDKRGSVLSIMRLGAINKVAQRYCRENFLSTIKVGRSVVLKD